MKPDHEPARLSPVKAIRKHCLEDCSGGSRHEVRNCIDEMCPLWPYRLGRNPARAGVGGNPGAKRKANSSYELSRALAGSENVQDEG